MGDLFQDCIDRMIDDMVEWHMDAEYMMENYKNEMLIKEVEYVIENEEYDEDYLELVKSIIQYYKKYNKLSEKQRWSLCLFATEYVRHY